MVNKQNTVGNLLNKHHIYMCRNSSKPGKIFNKNTNAQPVQINATAEKRFQTQKRNNLTVKSNTYYTESDAERRPSEWRNTATSGHRKKINNREATYWILSETAREICTNKKKPHISTNSNGWWFNVVWHWRKKNFKKG